MTESPSINPPPCPSRIKSLDVFASANIVLFACMCVTRYFDRFVAYRGAGNIHEFFIYAVGIMTVIGLLWWHFRQLPIPAWLLWGLQAGIAMHFAGGFVTIDGHRLYDTHLFGIDRECFRFDKLVHFVNAFIATLLVGRLQPHLGSGKFVAALFVMLTVLGLGSIVEIVEYMVCLTIPDNGVGSYDNNMQDLIANFLGGSFYVAFQMTRSTLSHEVPPACANPQIKP